MAKFKKFRKSATTSAAAATKPRRRRRIATAATKTRKTITTTVVKNLNLNSPTTTTPVTTRCGGAAAAQCVFRNCLDRLIECIDNAHGVVGCVAWMTHPKILEALKKKAFVSIIVQKEPYLRTGYRGVRSKWYKEIRDSYVELPPPPTPDQIALLMPTTATTTAVINMSAISYHGILGSTTGARARARGARRLLQTPRMHHKFLVFCGADGQPQSTWTGSFNFTVNATNSLENAVILSAAELPDACQSYLREWATVYGESSHTPNFT